jgi:hypothetical protein
MTWNCPHQIKSNDCSLRKEECKPGSDGCVLAKRYKFVTEESNLEFLTTQRSDEFKQQCANKIHRFIEKYR